MRVVMATAVVASVVSGGGESMGCLGGDRGGIEVHWEIPEGPGASGVHLLGCEDWGARLADGGEHLTAEPGWRSCALRGWRQDGQLRVVSTAVPLAADAEVLHVDFDLPVGPIGGVGAMLHATGWGARVDDVLPGLPAARGGLEPGDLIVEIDGVAATRMSTARVVRAIVGAPGTTVVLGIERDSVLERVSLVRERIPD
jgi:membrane-associated protease RseP (regulator of RpoE activity)